MRFNVLIAILNSEVLAVVTQWFNVLCSSLNCNYLNRRSLFRNGESFVYSYWPKKNTSENGKVKSKPYHSRGTAIKYSKFEQIRQIETNYIEWFVFCAWLQIANSCYAHRIE